MHPKMFAQLHEAMQEFLDSAALDDETWEAVYWPSDVALKMSRAAEQVFDATVDASAFAEEQMEEEES